MRAMEDYFITLTAPMTVDLSGGYFMEGGDGKDFERDYYLDCYRAAGKLCAGDGRTSVYIPDEQIWFERVMKYYRNMTARSYQNWLLDMNWRRRPPDSIHLRGVRREERKPHYAAEARGEYRALLRQGVLC